MIRLLLALIIVALLLTKVSDMFEEKETTPRPPSAPEDTMIGGAYEPYTRAQQFSDDYGKALEERRKQQDQAADDS